MNVQEFIQGQKDCKEGTYQELVANEPMVSDFIDGQADCKNGIPHKSGSEFYDRGYAAQYELEQMNNERTSMGDR